jgi:hypothetical protein
MRSFNPDKYSKQDAWNVTLAFMLVYKIKLINVVVRDPDMTQEAAQLSYKTPT